MSSVTAIPGTTDFNTEQLDRESAVRIVLQPSTKNTHRFLHAFEAVPFVQHHMIDWFMHLQQNEIIICFRDIGDEIGMAEIATNYLDSENEQRKFFPGQLLQQLLWTLSELETTAVFDADYADDGMTREEFQEMVTAFLQLTSLRSKLHKILAFDKHRYAICFLSIVWSQIETLRIILWDGWCQDTRAQLMQMMTTKQNTDPILKEHRIAHILKCLRMCSGRLWFAWFNYPQFSTFHDDLIARGSNTNVKEEWHAR